MRCLICRSVGSEHRMAGAEEMEILRFAQDDNLARMTALLGMTESYLR
jgi:hypothetical protein